MEKKQPKPKICEQCAREYLAVRECSRFCSPECRTAHQAAGNLPAQEKQCIFCGNLFSTSRHWSKFCSNRCRNGYHNARHREAKKA